jgi:N-acetylglutamate synthase/N-acetylornithine aminotransferase
MGLHPMLLGCIKMDAVASLRSLKLVLTYAVDHSISLISINENMSTNDTVAKLTHSAMHVDAAVIARHTSYQPRLSSELVRTRTDGMSYILAVPCRTPSLPSSIFALKE